MNFRREDFEIGCSSWIPPTPAKLNSTPNQPICTNWQETHLVQTNWLEPETLDQFNPVKQSNRSESVTLPWDFQVEAPRHTVPGNYNSINSKNRGFDTWQASDAAYSHVYRDTWDISESSNSVYGKNLHVNDMFPVNDDTWTNLSFGSLLALANTGNTSAEHAVTTNDFVATSSRFAPGFNPHIGSSHSTMIFGNSSVSGIESLLGENFGSELNYTPHIPSSGSTIHSRPLFDLNAPARAITDAASSENMSFQFEPITSAKTNLADKIQEPSLQNLSVPGAKDAEVNRTMGHNANGQNEKKHQSHVVTKTGSTQLQENHKPDKGGMEEADFSKTPQQKPRRRKHRPKVVIEGQIKNTPKPRARKPSVPEESPRFRRTYVRRNGINSPINSRLEGDTVEINLAKEASTYNDTPVIKRKYVRKKGINKPETSVDKQTTEIIDSNTMRSTRSSCRKSLNFESYCPSSNHNIESQPQNFSVQDQPTVQSKHSVGIAYELTHSTNKVLGDFMSMPDRLSLSPSPTTKKDLPHDYWVTGQSTCDKGKCQIVFSDVMHDKDSTYISSHLTQETQARGFKRQHMSIDAKAESSNATGSFNNFMQRYLSAFYTPGMHFPTIYKKKRTEKVYNTATSSVHSTMTASDSHAKFERHSPEYSFPQFVSRTNQGCSVASFEVTKLLMNNSATDGIQNGGLFGDLLALGPKEGIKKKRSKVPTRVRNLASLIEWKGLPVAPGRAAKASGFEQVREPPTCMEALVADSFSTITTKKRSKRSLFINSTVRRNFNYQALGAPLAIKWKSISPIDWIVEQLNRLDINAESRQVSTEKQKAVKAYRMDYQEQHALVPYQRGGALVPFDPVKKRRPRPKVDLDDETARVWKLLLENINSEGVDGADEEKAKWWEEERRVFSGRADSFIARMHLVQGDRRFSPWKGSVVDSVVGVFLTQNVSDHLSSSAFMSMAADFALESTINPAELPEERLQTKIEEPEVYILDPDETFGSSNQVLLEPVNGGDAKMLQNLEVDEIRVMNGVKYSGNSSDGSVPEENLKDPLQDMSNSGPIKSYESFPNKSMSLTDKERDMDDTFSSETSVISSQNSADSPTAQTEKTEPSPVSNSEEELVHGVERNSFTSSTSFARLLQMAGIVLHGYEEGSDKKVSDENRQKQSQSLDLNSEMEHDLPFPAKPSKLYSKSTTFLGNNFGSQTECLDSLDSPDKHNKFSDASTRKQCEGELSVEFASHTTFHKSVAGISKEDINISSSNADSSNNDKIEMHQKIVEKQTSQVKANSLFQDNDCEMQGISDTAIFRKNLMDVTGSSSNIRNSRKPARKEVNSNKKDPDYYSAKAFNGPKLKGGRIGKEKQAAVDWDSLRKQAQKDGIKRERTANTMDSVDWDAVRCANVNEIAQTIVARGMNHMLAERIKDFLNRLVRDHGSIDLEWLRDIPPDKAKEYLLSIRGLGLKSVECVRLLTLHHLAFPVDTNVGRIAVRLGWVPLQPLPESLQLHLLELYPVLESVQKYLWPRLCKLDQKTLYELHYQMITFGKVFCTKNKPNCNACPMRGECRHFASAFASARLALPAPEEKRIVIAAENKAPGQNPMRGMNALQLPSPLPVPDDRRLVTRAEDKTASQNQIRGTSILQLPSYHAHDKDTGNSQPIIEEPTTPEPIIEEPTTPEPIIEMPTTPDRQVSECDIEDLFSDDPDEIPIIHFQMEQFTQNLERVLQQNTEVDNVDMSKALVALTPEAASINVPKLKNVNRLRTEHQVYELPDSHRLLEEMDRREPDDPSPYLLAIWTPGETVDSIEPPERRCSTKELGKLCTYENCLSCNSIREQNSQTVRGTLLIPCRTAMRGSFPLNGTYFQVNEVFSDHESSLKPIDVPRDWLWNLPRRTVYFGTSIPSIFKGLTTGGIQYCFWRGFVCVRGFDRKTRAPRPLIAKFHFPASKSKGKGKVNDD